MRAVIVTRPGGSEVLRVVDRPVREAGPGDVRIAVKAAAVNPTDIGLREHGIEGLEPPWVPGMDAAGTVESLGEGVERLGVGDAVMAAVSPRRPEGGAQAELIVVPVASVVPVLVRSFGANVVLPRGEDFPAAVRAVVPDGADGFFDTALLGRGAFPAIRDGGAMVVVRGWDGGDPERGIQIHPILVGTALERTDWLLELRELASQGRIALRVAVEYPPEQAAEAQQAMEAGGLRGRAVIVF
jgi:NADPH:quinone reductase-like Zn-dependent oxidoreductase